MKSRTIKTSYDVKEYLHYQVTSDYDIEECWSVFQPEEISYAFRTKKQALVAAKKLKKEAINSLKKHIRFHNRCINEMKIKLNKLEKFK